MKNRVVLLVILSLVVIWNLFCTKDEEENLDAIDPSDKSSPVITISKPSANQVFASGDSIIVEGKVTDDKRLYNGRVILENDVADTTVAEGIYGTHFLNMISYRIAYKAVVADTTDFRIIVEFKDHGGNLASAIMKVKVIP